MKEHPLLFTAEMVRAVLDGRKTQTRRVPIERYRNWKVGDVIWVRETWCLGRGSWPGYKTYTEPTTKGRGGAIYPVLYRANQLANDADHKWKSSIHMFRKYARIFLEITGLRVDRAQDISQKEAIKEGIQNGWYNDQGETPGRYLWFSDVTRKTYGHDCPKDAFQELWDSINAKRHKGIYAWYKNPEIKVIEFTLI